MIFPDWGSAPETDASPAALPLFREWAVNWEQGAFSLRDGEPYLLSGSEALKVWIYKALHPESRRFHYTAWPPDYGNECSLLLGQSTDRGITESQLRRFLTQALEVSPYISRVDGFSFTWQKSRVCVRFTVHTVYDPLEETWEVDTL